MDIFVYSDESGVFDKKHNQYYVYGGLIFLSKNDRNIASRKYKHAERVIRPNYDAYTELKAFRITNEDKGKLFRSLNQFYKFGVVVNQTHVLDRIYNSKKDKQRYLDYAYKIGLKRAFERMIKDQIIEPQEVKNIHIFVDEHTTATNGRYELREGLEQEFKLGTYNFDYSKDFPPIFSDLNSLDVSFCDSSKKILIRAADIIANRLYFCAVSSSLSDIRSKEKFFLTCLPPHYSR